MGQDHDHAAKSAGADQQATQKDVVSDPGLGEDAGHDWSDEGGATPQGPAE